MRTSKTFMLKDDTRELLKIYVQHVVERQKRAVQEMMSCVEEQRRQRPENHMHYVAIRTRFCYVLQSLSWL